jgi:xanthine dehydrogenase YagR molybdenum-binding subunit
MIPVIPQGISLTTFRDGAKGLGEVGTVGVSAAIANAVYHATGRRIRSLPITLEKLL